MKKSLTLISIILLAFIALISFYFYKMPKKSSNESEKPFLIGMSQANLSEPWRIAMNEEIRKEAEQHENVSIIYRDAGGDSDKQKKDIDELLGYGVDLLIVSLNDSPNLTSAVNNAFKKVPVIVLDKDAEGCDYTLFIGPDNEDIGKRAGEAAAQMLGEKGGNILEIQGTLDSPPAVGISKGFKDALKQYKNIHIYMTVIGEWQRDETEDKVKDLIKSVSNVDIVFAQSDYMALGAYRAINGAGLRDVKYIGVGGLPGTNGGLDMLSRGILSSTFTYPTGGKEAIQYAIDILSHNSDIPRKVILKSDKITKDNLR